MMVLIETKKSAVLIIFYSHASKTHFHKKGFALSLVLTVRVLELGNGLSLVFFRLFALLAANERKVRQAPRV